ncbi:hypothetical protein [Aquipuribacter hungaricus]|uniref:Uncharacterized protein n=1 Tax=Aquipuribacter hungaricus TaxID=545624 RepID=A0ABV7WC41_9MICO
MVSFLANPGRSATSPDGATWHIRLVRGNAKQGWPLTRRLDRLNLFNGDWWVFVVWAVVGMVEGLPQLGRWFLYRVQRRSDWRVLVWRGDEDDVWRAAIVDERYPDKASAAAAAMLLLGSIRAGTGVRLAPPSSVA